MVKPALCPHQCDRTPTPRVAGAPSAGVEGHPAAQIDRDAAVEGPILAEKKVYAPVIPGQNKTPAGV